MRIGKTIDSGVSLRIRAVQVIKYVPRESISPFGAVEGGFQYSAEENPFEGVTAAPVETPVVSDELFGDDEPTKVKEPKKVVKKIKPAPKTSDDALASIVDDWDD
jgi:hypothetical protein